MKIIRKVISFDTLFIILILCIFAIGSMSLVLIGTRIYHNTYNELNSSSSLSTSLSYVASKIRQSDGTDAIKLTSFEDKLALEIINRSENCKTVIYNSEGSIYEIYLNIDSEFSYDDGIKLFDNISMDFLLNEQSITIKSILDSGECMSMDLYFRNTHAGNTGGIL